MTNPLEPGPPAWSVRASRSATGNIVAIPSARPAARVLTLAALCAVLPACPAVAQTWTFHPGIGIEETATNNVNLTPSSEREGDFVTQVTPSLVLREKGTNTNLAGTISLPFVVYARTGSENNNFYPSVNLLGDVQLVRNYFWVEGAVSVTQQFFNPFGAQPIDLANATQNRYRTVTYRVSPYIRGVTAGNTNYEVRNDNVWTNLSGAPINVDNARYTNFLATASNTQTQLGWRADLDYNDTTFNEQNSIVTRLGRVGPVYAIDPQLRLSANVGYEDNTYQFSESRGTIYGVGFQWRPTPRTSVLADWEHRFFGSSYRFSLEHRTPLSVWSVQASRNITTYPQLLGSVPAGVDVAGFLNDLFSSITNPADRQRAVDQLIQNRGLPSTLAGPVPLYSQQILLQQQASASVGLIGARNSMLFTVFALRSEPILGSGEPLPPAFAAGNDNTQTGASLSWTHNLAPTLVLLGSVNVLQTVSNTAFDSKTRQGTLRAVLRYSVTPGTSLYTGARYQVSSSSVAASDYDEAAVFAGIRYAFE